MTAAETTHDESDNEGAGGGRGGEGDTIGKHQTP